MQHTVLTKEFVNFLLDSGLRESDILQKVVWAALGIMCGKYTFSVPTDVHIGLFVFNRGHLIWEQYRISC